MTFTSQKWQLSRKGTIIIPETARASDLLIVRVEVLSVRKLMAQSFLRVPPQSVYGYLTARDIQGFVVRETPIRFSRQREVLYSLDQIQIGVNLCEGLNEVWDSLFKELAKKPNIPPLPPTVPPTINILAAVPRSIVHGFHSLSVAMLEPQADFTVELMWLERPESECAPEPEQEEPTNTPLEGGLPGPDANNPAPPGNTIPPFNGNPLPPPTTANVPAGFNPNDQYLPPVAAAYQYNLPSNYIRALNTSVSPAQCVLSPLSAIAFGVSDLQYSAPILVSSGGETACDPNYLVELGGVGLRFAGLPGSFEVIPLSVAPPVGFGVIYPR